jgi:hypothetical protein
MRTLIALSWLAGATTSGVACTCVTSAASDAKTLMRTSTVVFRGVVTERKLLPTRADMRGRNRYAITFKVEEYWKGPLKRLVVIYGVDPGTDCLGDGGYQVGQEYLVYATETYARDFYLGEDFWYGWADILPLNTRILIPDTACMPGGEISSVKHILRELGKGSHPSKP